MRSNRQTSVQAELHPSARRDSQLRRVRGQQSSGSANRRLPNEPGATAGTSSSGWSALATGWTVSAGSDHLRHSISMQHPPPASAQSVADRAPWPCAHRAEGCGAAHCSPGRSDRERLVDSRPMADRASNPAAARRDLRAVRADRPSSPRHDHPARNSVRHSTDKACRRLVLVVACGVMQPDRMPLRAVGPYALDRAAYDALRASPERFNT